MHFSIEATRVFKEVVALTVLLPFDTGTLWVMLYVAVFSNFFFGYLLSSWIGGSERGFFMTGMGLTIPWVIGIFAYAVLRVNIEQFLPDESLYLPICLSFGVLVAIGSLVGITPLFLGMDFIRVIVVFICTTALVLICVYFASYIIALLDYGKDVVLPSDIKHGIVVK